MYSRRTYLIILRGSSSESTVDIAGVRPEEPVAGKCGLDGRTRYWLAVHDADGTEYIVLYDYDGREITRVRSSLIAKAAQDHGGNGLPARTQSEADVPRGTDGTNATVRGSYLRGAYLAFSPDLTWLAILDFDDQLTVMRLQNQTSVEAWQFYKPGEGRGNIRGMNWISEQELLSYVDNEYDSGSLTWPPQKENCGKFEHISGVYSWSGDTRSFSSVMAIESELFTTESFSPGERYVAKTSHSTGKMLVYDLKERREIASLELGEGENVEPWSGGCEKT